MKTIKIIIISMLKSLSNIKWCNNNKPKVLIRTNNYFTKSSWLKQFEQEFTDYTIIIDLKFAANKIESIKLLPKANYYFSYGISNQINIETNSLILSYYGMAGMDSVSNLHKNIQICTPKGVSSKAIAEYCLAMVLTMQNNIHKVFKNQRKSVWDQQPVIKKGFESIENKKVIIFGLGQNGQAIAKIFNQNGCQILGYDIAQNIENKYINDWITYEQISNILPTTDIVISAMPLTNETKKFFNKEKLGLLNNNCIFINISRGELVDEKELIKILKQQKIQGAILDVFEKEPLKYFSPLRKLSNVIITPHISGNINRFRDEIQKDFIKILINHLNV